MAGSKCRETKGFHQKGWTDQENTHKKTLGDTKPRGTCSRDTAQGQGKRRGLIHTDRDNNETLVKNIRTGTGTRDR